MGPLHHGGLTVVFRLLRVFLQQKLYAFYDAFPEASSQTFLCSLGFPGGSGGKESACKAGDPGLIPGSGKSPGERNGNPLQYSCLENFMDRGAWWAIVHVVAKNLTLLSS